MPERRDPPPTEEGWYVLHDFRRVDWDAWHGASENERNRAVERAVTHLESTLAVESADEGASALYSVLGHEADLLVLHLRPTTAEIGALERRFEATEFARFTERATSFVSVTEASGYSERAREYFDGNLDEDSGLARYIRSRLEPTVPDATHVCFYPMDKRRDPDQNWYDLSFEKRAEHMDAHGDIGRDYGGRVTQMITGAIALDDWEWGVTLWGDDLAEMKDLLYEMRFDPSTSRYAEFGSFYVGRRFPPADLPALLAGDPVPTDNGTAEAGDPVPTDNGTAETDAAAPASPGESAGVGRPSQTDGGEPDQRSGAGGDPDSETVEDVTTRVAALGLEPGDDYETGDHCVVCYAEADATDLADEVDGLRGNFEHYDSHVATVVRAEGGRSAVASVWDTGSAADTAQGFLTDLTGVVESVRGPLGGASETAEDGADTTEGETGTSEAAGTEDDVAGVREELSDLDIYAGQPHGEDIYALVLYSQADHDSLVSEVDSLAESFDRYDTHEGTSVYEDPGSDTLAVVSLWATGDAADTASGFLADLPGVVGWARGSGGFATMGMFYTVEPEYREEFRQKFETVGGLLEEMDGHRETSLLVNVADENDMFIASQWDSKGDAMAFFRSDAFTDAVDWGRDALADRPRHVFLA
jgi:chlorite dismutase/heme-degrading monooxygenase HmoA